MPPNMGLGPMIHESHRGRFVVFEGTSALWEYSTASPASYDGFGNGCAGTVGIPVLLPPPFQLPWIADTFRVQVGRVPAGAPVVMAMGFTPFQPPVALDPLGMPGCSAWLQPAGRLLLPAPNQIPEWSLAIPNNQGLRGLTFYHQAAVLDPTANAAGVIVSDAAVGVVGMR